MSVSGDISKYLHKVFTHSVLLVNKDVDILAPGH